MTEENRTEKKVLLEAKHLTKCYGDLLVLDDISEEIREGEIVAVIGPSGGGKSTFLRCLNVLEDPTAGQIVFDGEDLTDLKIDINVCRQKMGMVFQQFNLFNNLTVLKNITLAPIIVNKGKLRNAKIHNFFMPFYNRYLEKNKSKIYAKIDKKLAKQKKIIEDTRVLLAPVEKEWESTKKVVENAGKNSLATTVLRKLLLKESFWTTEEFLKFQALAFQSRRQSQSFTAEKSKCKTQRTKGDMRACALRWRFMGFENSPSPSNPFIRRRQDFENFWLISAIIFRIGSLVPSGIFSREAMVLENL